VRDNTEDRIRVLLNSLPKSGTNLVQKCFRLASIPYSGRSVAASSCFGRHAFAKKILRQPQVGEVPVPIGLEVPVTVSPSWLQRYLGRAHGYVSGHGAYSDHYYSILRAEDYRVVQVVRHPCAVLASWANYIVEPGYYWKKAYLRLRGMTFPERVNFLLYGGGDNADLKYYYRGFRDVLLQIEGWVAAADVLTVRYEDLVGKSGGGSDDAQRFAVEEILRHIGSTIDVGQIDHVVSNLFGGTHTFRKGSIDGWKNTINEALATQIYDELKDTSWLSRLNYFG
jgi:hypothetical protein